MSGGSSAAGQRAEGNLFSLSHGRPQSQQGFFKLPIAHAHPRLPSAVTQNTKRAFWNSDKNLKENRANGAIYAKRHKNSTD